jgi:hypothetical protein
MPNSQVQQSVNIRPGVSILSVLSHLNYKPWFALAEFVDNSLQSFFNYHEQIKDIEGDDFKLRVSIELNNTNDGYIAIRDNAAGIHDAEYTRAFRPAEIPPQRDGLSEFGMGMKSAACWFASNWTVRTAAVSETVEKTISFDIGVIVRDEIEELNIQAIDKDPNVHFTEIVLTGLHRTPQGQTIRKIKDHLASIYRVFIKEGILDLRYNDDILTYEQPKILKSPNYRTPTEDSIEWQKPIDFDFGLGLRATGFAGLRETGSTSHAGFSLFRRNRLIQGSVDEGYRPEYIFGKSNSFTFQRLFGELHLEGFDVSHTKDGFRWDENEDVFLELLKDELQEGSLNLLDQAEGYRARPRREDISRGAQRAVQTTGNVVERETPPIIERLIEEDPVIDNPPDELPPSQITASIREIDIEINRIKWKIYLELSNDPAIGEWISMSDFPETTSSDSGEVIRELKVRLSLAHPFMERFGGTDSSSIEPLLRVAVAICLAEISARESGIRIAGTMRRNINELLRDALSQP